MNEDFLHFIWKYGLYEKDLFQTHNGNKIVVIEPGIHNRDSGPDFFNARIKIGETTWAGNVEIHIKSSDWYKHSHQLNKAYDSIILQVVGTHDKNIYRQNKQMIPVAEMKYNSKYLKKYNQLLKNKAWIPCEKEISCVEDFVKSHWLTVLTIERLKRKTDQIKQTFELNKNDWEETFYQYFARSFGYNVNADPFEWLAKSIRLKILAKHKNNPMQIEALLFGQAGFLEDEIEDEYYNKLKSEYQYLSKKYRLKPIDKHLWKFLRLRPSNFPTIRIAQFSNLIFKSSGLYSKIINALSYDEIQNLINAKCSEYWEKHYLFGKISKKREKVLGKLAVNIIIINTIVPFLFFYGEMKGIEAYKDWALNLLETIPPENNSIIKKWQTLGFMAENSYITQSLLQLKNEHCNKKGCMECQVGNYIISKC